MKTSLLIISLLFLSLSTHANTQYTADQLSGLSDYQAGFGDHNGAYIASFEPCVHKENSGGWYDHCFFNMQGTNSFNEAPSKISQLCANKSHQTLKNWLQPGQKVKEAYDILQKTKGNKAIYIIVTDTYKAKSRNTQRSSLWSYPESSGEGYYFKFNIAISNSGICNIPSEEQMLNTIKNWVGESTFAAEKLKIMREVAQTSPEAMSRNQETVKEENSMENNSATNTSNATSN